MATYCAGWQRSPIDHLCAFELEVQPFPTPAQIGIKFPRTKDRIDYALGVCYRREMTFDPTCELRVRETKVCVVRPKLDRWRGIIGNVICTRDRVRQ